MSHFAIIIGVDHYENPAWRLTAAVDDALAFREWALGPGGVPPENVHLLLSPAPGRELGVPYKPADSEHLIDLIHEFQRGLGADGERLYFYYAGHGAAAPGAHDEVALLPADVRAWPRDARRIIGFSELIPPLQQCGPAAQFFFIDACRDLLLEDFARGAAPVVGRWKGPPGQNTPERRAQYLLYATSPGGRALEVGQGVFGRILLQGLKGYPGALVWSQRERCYELRFSQLADFVRTSVETQVKRLGGTWRQFLQLPEQDVPPGLGISKDFVLARFSPEQVGKLSLRIRVQPAHVRQTCDVSVLFYAPGGIEVPIQTVKPQPPAPLPFPVELQLSPGDYMVLANTVEFGEDRQPCTLYQPQTVELRLDRRSVPGFEMFSMDHLWIDPRQGLNSMSPSPERMHSSSLTVLSKDDKAQIVCIDPDRQAHTGLGDVTIYDAPAGIYRARLVLPEGAFLEKTLEVYPSRHHKTILEKILDPSRHHRTLLPAPPPSLGAVQWGLLQALGLSMDSHGYISFSNEFGFVAGLRLASLLGFAAFQASVERPWGGVVRELERLSILPPASIPVGGSGVLVLLGASHNQPAPGVRVPDFLSQSRVTLRSASTNPFVEEGTFQTLPQFAAAAQWARSVAPGSWILELSLPHIAPTRYALTALRDHLNILVIVADDSGEVEVQQYMAPLAAPQRPHASTPPLVPSQSIDPLTNPSVRQTGPAPLRMWALRDLELGQRYLASGATVPSRHLEHLLRGHCLDPLLGCVAGYALVREGQQERYTSLKPDSHLIRTSPDLSVLQDMLRYFDALPDVHILAGLCEPDQREAHFQRAMERGLPLFSDGLRALQRRVSNFENPWYAAASRNLLPGSLWTAWVER